MRFIRLGGLALALVVLAATGRLAQAQAQAQLPVVELGAGLHLIHAELAADDRSRMRGLMFRKSLGPNEGMLFVFDESTTHCMWMKNTLVPLSVAFLDESAHIINVADMAPHSEASHCATRPARYALEMQRGWFSERGLGPGTEIRGIVRRR
jgi:uncharacterized membrane protein (UPF0127 family)